MPRVHPDHLAARRAQILAAAERRFSRHGFHATSMQDVFAEAGLSAGAVYRYYPSKIALIRAVAEDIVESVAGRIAAVAQRPSGDELAAALPDMLVGLFFDRDGISHRGEMALQVWAESLRDAELNRFATGVFARLTDLMQDLVDIEVAHGRLPSSTNSRSIARALVAVAQGLLLRLTVVGDVTRDEIRADISAVVSGLTTGIAPTQSPSRPTST